MSALALRHMPWACAYILGNDRLLGLLYHTTLDRKGVPEVQYYQLPTYFINWYAQMNISLCFCKFCLTNYEDLPVLKL